MKKVLIFLMMSLIFSQIFALEITLQPSYGILLSPSFSDIEDIPGSKVSKGGLGISLQGILGKKDKVEYGIEVGYQQVYNWEWETNILGMTTGAKASITAIPLLGIVKYNLENKIGNLEPYLFGAAGLFLCSGKASVTASIIDPFTGLPLTYTAEDSTSETDFGFSLGLGSKVIAGEKTNLDLIVRYTYITTEDEASSLLNIGLGIRF